MIRNLIFDFGDVFINLDKTAPARAMQKFGPAKHPRKMYPLFKDYEKGLVSTEGFLEAMGGHFPKADRKELVAGWNAMLLDFPEERLVFLENLANGQTHRLFLLSNTNEMHIETVKQRMGTSFARFKNVFEAFYLSCELHMRKPDAEVFEHVLRTNGLSPRETLFVDDTKENTDSAARLGMQTWHLQVGKEDITQLKHQL